MESVEEKVDITALLQGILNAYPGNSAILREYLQNSDDARAKKQVCVSVVLPVLCVLSNIQSRFLSWMRGTILPASCAIKVCAMPRDQHSSRSMMVSYQRGIGMPSRLYIHPVRRQMRRLFFPKSYINLPS
jgi:hypothetical protein